MEIRKLRIDADLVSVEYSTDAGDFRIKTEGFVRRKRAQLPLNSKGDEDFSRGKHDSGD